jgi:hypothetical protein
VGDVVVGDCLIDFKLTEKVNVSQIYQVLAYALMDLDDAYSFRNVALYLAAFGVLLE